MAVKFKGLFVLVWVAAMALPGRAMAVDTAQQARQHFDRGIALSDAGDLQRAILEFQLAYEIHPHPAVLFNLGQVLGAAGRAVEAVRALRAYLDGMPEIERKWRLQVEETLRMQESRIGRLDLRVRPEGTLVTLNARELGRAPLQPLELDPGSYGLVATADGYDTATTSVTIEPSKTTRLELQLERRAPEPAGLVLVNCDVPEVSVVVNAAPVARTPVAQPLVLAPGVHRIAFFREGYVPNAHVVTVPKAGIVKVSCELACDPHVSTAALSGLEIKPTESDAVVRVDGRPFGGELLPPGAHVVEVERLGFYPWREVVRLQPNESLSVQARLEPTPKYAAEYTARAEKQRYWAVATGLGGLVVAGAGLATYIWNSDRYDEWRNQRSALVAELSANGVSPALIERDRVLQDRAHSIQRVDVIVAGLGVIGVGLVGLGGTLWWAGPDPRKYAGQPRLVASAQGLDLQFDW